MLPQLPTCASNFCDERHYTVQSPYTRPTIHQFVQEQMLFTYLLTELSPSREAASCAVTQEHPSILWSPKFQYRVHKSTLLVPILSHINPIHTIPSYLAMIHLILSTHLRLGLPSGLFPSGFPTNMLCVFVFPIRVTCPTHFILLDLIILIIL
jgi:hypothetical protein